jgi:hypothetical protein
MKNLRQLIKIILTPKEVRAVCITTKGNSLALGVELDNKPEVKKLVDDFSTKLLEILEKELM